MTHRSARTVGRWALVPVWCVVIGLLVIAVVRVVAFDRFHWFLLADAYALWVFLPAYVIGVAALLFRARRLAAAALVLVVVQLAWVLPPVFRSVDVPAAAAAAPHLRVVSANVNYENRRHRAVLAELVRTDADVILLQEVTPAWRTAIERSPLVRRYPYRVVRTRADAGGQAVLSRLPLAQVVVHRTGGWPVITARVRVGGRTVHLVDVHPAAPLTSFAFSRRQQDAITAFVRALPRPRLVAGDFNASPYNEWYGRMLELGLREAHEAVGRPWATTWPNGEKLLPPLRLDHVFADASLVPLAAREGRGAGSDHRPIVVDVAVLARR